MKLISLLLFTLVILVFSSCSDECDGEKPSVKLVNMGTGDADIQVKTSGGNTENINNIQVGQSSEKRTFAPGDITFTISIHGVKDPIVYDLTIINCRDYTVTIEADNSVTYTSKARE